MNPAWKYIHLVRRMGLIASRFVGLQLTVKIPADFTVNTGNWLPAPLPEIFYGDTQNLCRNHLVGLGKDM